MFSIRLFLLVIGVAICLHDTEARKGRIFNGNYDTENQHKYFVSIIKLGSDNSAKHICGGVIIDNYYALTAAHCVQNENKKDLLIRSGWRKMPSKPLLEKQIYHEISKIMYPKDYHNSTCRSHQYDIAVLKIETGFDLEDHVNFGKASLPSYDHDYENHKASFIGYGAESFVLVATENAGENATQERSYQYPKQLKYFDTEVMALEKCKRELNVIVTKENLCSVPKNETGFSCVGDGGSPLMIDGVVVALRNKFSECVENNPELFTSVSSMVPFIKQVLNKDYSSAIIYAE